MILQNNTTTIILCFLSVVTLVTGFWFYFSPPKEMNFFYGYRTKQSMKSQKHWDFAHFYSGKLFILFGLILLIYALFIYLLDLNSNISNVIAILFFAIGCFIVVLKTETSIKKKFEE